jgi:hypothetical protein
MMLDWMMKWLRGASYDEALRLVNSDAEVLIARFGEAAYDEARERAQRSGPYSHGRSAAHWKRVKLRIRRLRGIQTGLGAADRYD